MEYWLRESLKQREREMGAGYDPETESGDYPEMYQDITNAANSWFFNCVRIVDIGNWRFKNLISMDGGTIRIKKPQLLLSVEVTPQGDITLSWYPVSVHKTANYRELEENSRPGGEDSALYEYNYGDWLVWDCQQYPGEAWRRNSIIRIRHFGKLMATREETTTLPKSEQYLLKALKCLQDNIFGFLEQLVEVEIQDIFTVAETDRGFEGRIGSRQEAAITPKTCELKKVKQVFPSRTRCKPAKKRSVSLR